MATTKTEAHKVDGNIPDTPIAEEPEKEVMGIERDDNNARVSFTKDNGLMIITIPIARMPRALAHGFLYELHTVVNEWHEERKKNAILTRDAVSKFSFKSGINKLFK